MASPQHRPARRLPHLLIAMATGALLAFAAVPVASAQSTSLVMTSDPGDFVGAGQSYAFTPADGSFTATSYAATESSGQQVHFFFNTPGYSHFFFATFSAPVGQPLVPGVYLNAERFGTPSAGGVSVGGDGRGCNESAGFFVVLEAEYGPSLEVLAFRAKFEQHCEGAAPALRGEVRYNANVAFELTAPMAITATAGQPINIAVSATGSLSPVALSSPDLPAGASFTDAGNSTGTFSWADTAPYPGEYFVWFVGTNGEGATEIAFTGIRIAPVNDNLSHATALGANAGAVTNGTTAGASVQAGELGFGQRTVWYKFTPGYSHRAVLDTEGSSLDTLVTLYYDETPATPVSFEDLVFVDQNDDDGDAPHSRIVFDAVAGRTYFVAVSAWQDTGPFQLRWRHAELARLLWERSDGAVALWTIDGGGALIANPTFGPFPGWKAVKIAVGSDKMTRVLWRHQTGMVTVWTVDRAGAIVSHPAFGPYSGWTASDIVLDREGQLHLGWIRDNGSYGFWLMSADAVTLHSSVFYGPYAGWQPRTFSVTENGERRILWQSATGALGLWTEPPPYGVPSVFDVDGPYVAWQVVDIASGDDGSGARVLWEHSNGTMALYRQAPGGHTAFGSVFGPYTGWRPVGVSLSNVTPQWHDWFPRVLWRHTGGGIAVWRMNFDHQWAYTYAYGPFAGWTAVDIAVGPE